MAFFAVSISTRMLCLLSLCIPLLFTAVVALPDSTVMRMPTPSTRFSSAAASLRQFYPQIAQGKFNIWQMASIVAVCGLVPGLWYFQRRRRGDSKSVSLTSSEPSIRDGMTNGSAVTVQKSVDVNGKLPEASCLQSLADRSI